MLLACRRAFRSGCRGFRPRFFLWSGLASRICGLFCGTGWTRGVGFAFLEGSSSSEEDADDERPEEDEDEERLSLVVGGVGCNRKQKNL